MDPQRRLRVADDFVRRFAAALRATQLYAPTHPLVRKALDGFEDATSQLLADQPTDALGVVGDELVMGDAPIPKSGESFGEVIRRLRGLGIERVSFDRGVSSSELTTFILAIAHPEKPPGADAPSAAPYDPMDVLGALQHIRVGRIHVDDRLDAATSDMAAIRKQYSEASGIAQAIWEAAETEGIPDPRQARALIESLAHTVAQNRTALLALTALRDYDNYTFTHMVNVSILTMAQARALGVDGTMLREFGMAALMHDIGKVRTPKDVLNKPARLDDKEFAIMRRHVVDGAEILRRTPEIPAIAPIVAFEHHLRLDGTGYPFGVSRSSLNLGTMLCSIADVYDAMRSQRAYQQRHPSDRILAVLQGNDGQHFDKHLVRRFTQLLGIYPPGNVVRLNTGAIAVVLQVHAPDPYRPRVRVITNPTGLRLDRFIDVNLWESVEGGAAPSSITGPVDATAYGIDPLTFL
jgi:putative nucleotidyltransferase with HDIG domain